MQQEMFIQQEDFSEEEIMVGISAGINSAAVLVWLSLWPKEYYPKVLHLYYAHFEEHSPESFAFVKALIKFAREKFPMVVVKITRNSVLRFFEKEKMIPHPAIAPCTRILKVIPMHEYMKENGITTDLVGYVREEIRRVKNMSEKTDNDVEGRSVQIGDVKKLFPISDKTNEWCFTIVKKAIGWYPPIYDLRWNNKKFIKFMVENLHRVSKESQASIKKKLGKRERVFSHNNCLPCKNFQEDDYLAIEFFYYNYWMKSVSLSARLKAHWGRLIKETKGTKTIEDIQFHMDFGRTEQETNYQKQSCGVCAF
jgi:3'-phosphoadenosine 5'-phosphosulfate sulfotransferase (PAPS reductase)/FAD synthetase